MFLGVKKTKAFINCVLMHMYNRYVLVGNDC